MGSSPVTYPINNYFLINNVIYRKVIYKKINNILNNDYNTLTSIIFNYKSINLTNLLYKINYIIRFNRLFNNNKVNLININMNSLNIKIFLKFNDISTVFYSYGIILKGFNIIERFYRKSRKFHKLIGDKTLSVLNKNNIILKNNLNIISIKGSIIDIIFIRSIISMYNINGNLLINFSLNHRYLYYGYKKVRSIKKRIKKRIIKKYLKN